MVGNIVNRIHVLDTAGQTVHQFDNFRIELLQLLEYFLSSIVQFKISLSIVEALNQLH
jgi:hypothetical protein